MRAGSETAVAPFAAHRFVLPRDKMSKERTGQRHKNKIYFKDQDLDLYLQAFPLNFQTYGGAATGEAFYAASRVNEKDLESWVHEWCALAARVEAEGAKALERGHEVSAREAYLRAYTYYRTATLCLRVADSRFCTTWQTMRSCFRRAAELFEPPIEPVEIPYQRSALPAYYVRAGAADERRPTVIVIGGGETFCEDLYFWGGAGAVNRGYNALLVDMPGQGATAFEGMHHRHDVEVPMGAVLDYLQVHPDVDTDRVGAYGVSLGGYILLRSAAFEERIKACAVSTPIVDWHQTLMDAMPSVLRSVPRPLFNVVMKLGSFFSKSQLIAYEKFFEWQVGAQSYADALEKFRPWKVDVSRISCPVLCMMGTGEQETFQKQTHMCYAALKSPKALRVFTEEEGADAHSQANNQRLAHQVVFDFFDETFAPKGRTQRVRVAEGA
jgi:pimeloyl-ACP methyl ester carboxylesterase